MPSSFVELEHHYALCLVQQKGDGFSASVTFELRADHGKTSLPARKFNLPGRFSDADDAMKQAIGFAQTKDESRSVGL